jgi:hypothetical protein
MSEYATTPPLDPRQLASLRLDAEISAAQRRLNDAGRSTKRGADLANHLGVLLAERRALDTKPPSESPT